jgi:ABC-type nickel/cobalt efflux system permease component RcnA
MAPLQKTLNESLAAITRSLQESRSLGGLLFIMLVSLAYGMFHAAGPGHGKTIVSSFFLANEAKLRHSFTIGYLIAIVHALSALAIVLILSYLIRGFFTTNIEQANRYIQLVTFGIITALGAFMLMGRIRGGEHHHAHGSNPTSGITMRNLLAIAIPAGAIPCPGAVAVILFALSLRMLGVSILSVASISFGMGVTISVTGAIVILAKRGALKAVEAGGHHHDGSIARRVIEIGGAALLFLFGLVFFLAQL